jgi:mRNA-degrading endonuclease RelE of RelBE toxin-antitoxin system
LSRAPPPDYLELVDFSDEARRELLSLPADVRERFFASFPTLADYPTGGGTDLDIQNLHDPRGRPTRYWRLKVVGGYRAIYRILQGRVHIEAIRPRPGVYSWVSKIRKRRR